MTEAREQQLIAAGWTVIPVQTLAGTVPAYESPGGTTFTDLDQAIAALEQEGGK